MSSPVTLRGRLVKAPELRYTNDGKAIAQFAVVTSRRFKDSNGDWQEKDTSFWDCTAFDTLAEEIIEKCDKGTPVIVVGQMRQEKWQTKEGENRTSWRVLVDDAAPSLKGKPSGGQPRPAVKATFTEPPPF